MPETATILLVDDTDAQRYALGRVLRNGGYTVWEAASAEDALEKAKNLPDLILLDVGLPGMNGYEVCRQIKTDPDTRSIPVLQMSASYVSSRHRVLGLEGGADGYLTPPLEGPELLANVKAMLRLREAEDRASRQAREIEAGRAELHAVMQSMAEGLARTDRDGLICYVNSAAEHVLGYSADELRGRHFHEVVHQNARACDKATCAVQYLSELNGRTHQSQFVRKDGSGITVEYAGAPYTVEGSVEGVVITFRDISERKRSEDALRVTEKLANTGRMAATIAHEINNPLEAITNLVYLISVSKNLDPDTRQYINMAQAELARVTRISKQTLGFYRQASSMTKFNLAEIVEGVLSLLDRKLSAAGIEVRRRFEAELTVRGYADEIRQVVSNLILNAIEAVGGRGTLLLHVYDSRDWRAGRKGVRFTILDSGSGIAPGKMHSIFEPFFTTKQEKGTGLGLWVSNGIMHKHGGFMRVRSSQQPGRQGTCFSFFLPLADAAEH